jgi:hypothetical protein
MFIGETGSKNFDPLGLSTVGGTSSNTRVPCWSHCK